MATHACLFCQLNCLHEIHTCTSCKACHAPHVGASLHSVVTQESFDVPGKKRVATGQKNTSLSTDYAHPLDQVRLTLGGGSNAPGCSGGRTLVYDVVCNASAPVSNPPDPIVGVDSGCTYIVTWQHPAACTATPAPPSKSCEPASLPMPTAPQLRYQTGEIVALTHFNMASFVQNGDPGCNAGNWVTKAPGAEGPSSDPATFNPTQLDTDQWADVYAAVGVKGAVLTAKHGCGFLLWPTNVTLPDGSPYSYGVGKPKSAIQTDVLRSFTNSMTKANITHGFYYSFTNNFFLNVAGHKANASPKVWFASLICLVSCVSCVCVCVCVCVSLSLFFFHVDVLLLSKKSSQYARTHVGCSFRYFLAR